MRALFTLAMLAAVAMPVAASAQAAKYTSATNLGILLEDPAAKAALMKVLPDLTPRLEGAKDQVGGISLVAIKAQAGITDEKIAELDAELAKIK